MPVAESERMAYFITTGILLIITEDNEDEVAYELDFHERYNEGNVSGLQIMEHLHNHPMKRRLLFPGINSLINTSQM